MAKTISKIMKGIGKFNKTVFTDVPNKDSYDSLMHAIIPKKIKGKYVYPIGAAIGGTIGAYKLTSKVIDMEDRATYGRIEGGEMSHMTNNVPSTLLSDMQNGTYDPNRVMHNSSYRDTGASGEVVLALHNRR